LLKGILVLKDGRTLELQQSRAGYGPRGPYAEEYLNGWDVPAVVTNFLDCEVRLSRKKDGASVAKFRLQ
jgi:hypothetical protein